MTQTTGLFVVSGLLLFGLPGCAATGPKVRDLSSGPFSHRAKTKYRLGADPSVPNAAGLLGRVRSIHPRLHYQVRVTSSGASGNPPEIRLTCRQDVGSKFRVTTYQYRLRPARPRTIFAKSMYGIPDGEKDFGRHTVEPGKQRLYVNVNLSGGPGLHRKWGRGVRLTIRSRLPFKAEAGQVVRIVVRLQTP